MKRRGYADGHEHDDVVRYRQEVFLKLWWEFQHGMELYDKIVQSPHPPLLLAIMTNANGDG